MPPPAPPPSPSISDNDVLPEPLAPEQSPPEPRRVSFQDFRSVPRPRFINPISNNPEQGPSPRAARRFLVINRDWIPVLRRALVPYGGPYPTIKEYSMDLVRMIEGSTPPSLPPPRPNWDDAQYYEPAYPPMRNILPLLAEYQESREDHREVRKILINNCYQTSRTFACRKQWEAEFMNYFRWKPWYAESSNSLMNWVESNDFDRTWPLAAKRGFIALLQLAPREYRVYQPVDPIKDWFSVWMQLTMNYLSAFNLAFVRCETDCYYVVPIGISRPIYCFMDFTMVEDTFLGHWYHGYYSKPTPGEGETDFDVYKRDYTMVMGVFEAYYKNQWPGDATYVPIDG